MSKRPTYDLTGPAEAVVYELRELGTDDWRGLPPSLFGPLSELVRAMDDWERAYAEWLAQEPDPDAEGDATRLEEKL